MFTKRDDIRNIAIIAHVDHSNNAGGRFVKAKWNISEESEVRR